MFFHYFLIYFCIFLLHEDNKVGRLALYHSLVLVIVQIIGGSPEYFFHEAVLHEVVLILLTVLVVRGRRCHILVALSALSIVINVLMYEFQTEAMFLFEHYTLVNRVLLETTICALLYDHKSKWRNLVLILIMLLIYTHEF